VAQGVGPKFKPQYYQKKKAGSGKEALGFGGKRKKTDVNLPYRFVLLLTCFQDTLDLHNSSLKTLTPEGRGQL
jgi:hypothetical protein